MFASEVIEKLARLIKEYGDRDVQISILTNNAENYFPISNVAEIFEVKEGSHRFSIDLEVEDVKEFKKGIK